MEQNNSNSSLKKLWLRFKAKINNNLTYRIVSTMFVFWLVVNIILLSLINSNITNLENQWKIISGFNLGAFGSLIGFLILALAGKWHFSKVSFKQVLAYFIFFIRILIYGTIIFLAIYFSFFSLISTIAGFSLLLVAVIFREFLIIKNLKKEKDKC